MDFNFIINEWFTYIYNIRVISKINKINIIFAHKSTSGNLNRFMSYA